MGITLLRFTEGKTRGQNLEEAGIQNLEDKLLK
jgi:hypothetical protein